MLDHQDLLAMRDEPLDPELENYFEEAGGQTGWAMVRHPLVYDVPYSGIPGLLNRRLAVKKEATARALASGDLNQYVWLHERAWRLNALVSALVGGDATLDLDQLLAWGQVKTIWQHRPRTRGLFLDVWSDSENTDSNAAVWSHLFDPNHPKRKPGEILLDGRGAREILDLLPVRFPVWRGISSPEYVEDAPGRVRSWTLDRERAEFFAQRWSGNRVSGNSGRVISKQVTRDDIIAIIADRGEMEVVMVS